MTTTAAADVTRARAGRIAGALYLVTMATGVFGFAVRSSLLVSGDVTSTARNILDAERLFRVTIVTDMFTLSGVIVLAWGLYVLLRPVDRDLAFLAMFFRIAENAVLCAATASGLMTLGLLRGAVYQRALEEDQLHALARLIVSGYGHGYALAFIFLGIGSAIFGYVLLKSRYVPAALAGWGVFASLILALGACAIVMFPGAGQFLQIASQAPMGIYEVSLGAWLLFRGPRLSPVAGGRA